MSEQEAAVKFNPGYVSYPSYAVLKDGLRFDSTALENAMVGVQTIQRIIATRRDELLREIISRAEGRMPTEKEIAKHGHCVVPQESGEKMWQCPGCGRYRQTFCRNGESYRDAQVRLAEDHMDTFHPPRSRP